MSTLLSVETRRSDDLTIAASREGWNRVTVGVRSTDHLTAVPSAYVVRMTGKDGGGIESFLSDSVVGSVEMK